ncbi:reductase [Nocardiopsis sp. N85]|uniref:NAD-dependent epimerase/dehydratase family protein n=1 Tax=Nocardiopsis sp. N85 TaxID=3029400 RepID=UPI00237F1EE8|nr:NAD-dependent epimerase/dehydratase family protein [Nocardiopsis sp. N85]MDE3723098.1 reductase [Nocardiopsis sp. N85]
MRLLVLGGTEFVGRAIVEDALERGWDVTVFHRGSRTAPRGATALHGDRLTGGGLGALEKGEWDAVVDTWSAAPRVVHESARLLADRVGRYAYISSCSVYAYPSDPGSDETWPTVQADPESDGTDYPADKRGGELAVEAAFGDRSLSARAGLILGPHENIGRLPWWLNRIARGGPFPAPGPADLPLQYVDARDLAAWTLDATASGVSGPHNLVSPAGHATMGDLLAACVDATGSDAEPVWLTPELIARTGVEPWSQLPVWVPPGEPHAALHDNDVSRALATGLCCRPVAETVADTWEWLVSLGGVAPQRPDRPPVGLPDGAEERLLAGTR